MTSLKNMPGTNALAYSAAAEVTGEKSFVTFCSEIGRGSANHFALQMSSVQFPEQDPAGTRQTCWSQTPPHQETSPGVNLIKLFFLRC
jgi:hypothetical protein